ncbi:hypothetical protein FKW77_008667 [Venturia effusa]|uniref:DAGKc domain-containing protein n=1 Tax=Venturia effusa TaxID=50376 RepID=A0A517LJE7_9PEZI|nr:hypothetical protein FKW77_008667 [Venturia effusa]
MASGLPIIPLQTLLDKHLQSVIAFEITCTGKPTWATCFLLDNKDDTEAEPDPKLLKVRTEDHDSHEALKRLIPEYLLLNHENSWLLKRVQKNHVVVSTKSGTGQASKFYDSILKPLLDHFGFEEGHNYVLHETKSADTIKLLAENGILHDSARGIEQNIILLSGDGGISDIINGLLKDGLPINKQSWVPPVISLIPLGTGNALANSSGIIGPNDNIDLDNLLAMSFFANVIVIDPGPKEFNSDANPLIVCARLLTNEGTELAPLPADNENTSNHSVIYGAVVCSWGLHATLVADSDSQEWRKLGDSRFEAVAKNLLDSPHIYRGLLQIQKFADVGKQTHAIEGNEPLSIDEHGYLLATFCSKLDAKFRVSPQSRPLDGRLMLVHFGPKNDPQEIWRLLGYGDGLADGDPAVTYREVDAFNLRFDEDDKRWRRICVDGHIIQVEKGSQILCHKLDNSFDVVQLRMMNEDG